MKFCKNMRFFLGYWFQMAGVFSLYINVGAVLDTHGLVGNSSHLATHYMLVCLIICEGWTSSLPCSSISGWRYLCMDIVGVLFASVSFPHENNELLVRHYLAYLPSALSVMMRKHMLIIWKLHTGETQLITSFMAAITSTQWMASDLSFLLLQQQF